MVTDGLDTAGLKALGAVYGLLWICLALMQLPPSTPPQYLSAWSPLICIWTPLGEGVLSLHVKQR
jgi:hypothetical protein